MFASPLLFCLIMSAQTPSAVPGAPMWPAAAPDGRVALSIDGHLWVGGPLEGRVEPHWQQLTLGPASDVEPSWTEDGAAVVFASDRGGAWHLWRLAVAAQSERAGGGRAAPEQLTSDARPDREPSVAADGAVVFVRGEGPVARLWLRGANGSEQLLAAAAPGVAWPAVSPDGQRVAYVARSEDGTFLRILDLRTNADSVVAAGWAAERPAWSPDGGRVAFGVAEGRVGTWVADAHGRYVNLLDSRAAAPAWLPGGRSLVLAALPSPEPAYNGDPARIDARPLRRLLPHVTGLWIVPAPVAPDADTRPLPVVGDVDRAAHNGEVFDRIWRRVRDLYYTDRPGIPHRSVAALRARQAQWDTLRAEYRPRAMAARDDSALAAVIHGMMRRRPPLREPAEGRAAVSSANPVATAAGLEVLRDGGNAVDAAVAVSFALGVVEPDASGIGGYGQMLVYRPGMSRPELIEFMTRTPEDAGLGNAELLRDGRYPDDGPVLTQVPGTLAGMYKAWQQYGSLPWKRLVEPAIRAARQGFEVSDGLATTLATERQAFLKYQGSRELFFPNGRPLQAGDTLRNPDLARTLGVIADSGADALYHGSIGRRMVEDLRAHGNPMRMLDLERYYAAEREPVSGTYRGYTIFSSAPPSAGGASLVAKLNLLENFPHPRLYTDDAPTLQAMIEAWRLQPSARGRIADPGLWPVDVPAMTSKDTARARWRCFQPGRATADDLFQHGTPPCMRSLRPDTPGELGARAAATPMPTVGATGADPADEPGQCAARAGGRPCRLSGTTAFVVADAKGDVVSATQTLGTWGGTFYVTPGLGFTYNDKLTSYALNPEAYGARLPDSRHGSTISPTIVFRGSGTDMRPTFAFGTAGNAWITAGVYQELVGLVDFGLSPQQALELPRFLPSSRRGPGGRRETVILAEDGFAPGVIRRLESMGYRFEFVSLRGELREGYGAALALENGRVIAGADPRRSGAAGAVP